MTQKRSWEDELNELLSEAVTTVIEREKTAFDRLVNPFNRALVLFGAGKLGRQALAQLRQDGIEPLAFADNNPAIWGEFVDGVQVFSPTTAAEKFGKSAAFVVTIWSPNSHHQFTETKKSLQSLSCIKIVSFLPLMWKYSNVFLPNCFVDFPHKIYSESKDVMKVYNFWEDEESRETYITQLKWRMLDDFDALPRRNSETQYFPASIIKLSDDEVFIDCGAYNGDTIKEFSAITNDKFKFIHAFEPDPFNFQELSNYLKCSAAKERIALHQKAIGSQIETLKFSATGTASSIVSTSGNVKIESIPLDNILKDIKPTFIKMDIEGAEISALMGAKNTIQQALPVLAICIYHKQNDLWKIPLLIKSYSSNYHLFLRAHQEEGWDLVCYAIPMNKIMA